MRSTDYDRFIAGGGAPANTPTIQMAPGAMLLESFADLLVATPGGGQAGAFQMVSQTNRIGTVVTAGDSVRLPVASAGLEATVINHGAKPMQVYGAGTDTINDVATATGVSQMQGSSTLYFCVTAGNWYTEGLASGFSGGFPTSSALNGLVAFAGGGQASATLVTVTINRFTTVASIGDSAKLPIAAAGMGITITNASANSMNVFPGLGDSINGAATNAAYALAAGKTATFTSADLLIWHAVLSA